MPERNKGSSRLHFSEEKTEAKAEKAAARVEKIRTNIPKKKVLSVTRATDEAAGKTRLRLHLEEKPKPAPSFHSMGVTRLPLSEVHRQIGKVEEENTGVEAAHHGEEAAERTVRLAEHSYRSHQLKPYRQLEKAEQKLDKANIRSLQQKAAYSSNPLSRWRQKQAIRKAYYAAQAAGGAFSQNPGIRVMRRIKLFFVRSKNICAGRRIVPAAGSADQRPFLLHPAFAGRIAGAGNRYLSCRG